MIFFATISCKENEQAVCAEIYVPMAIHIRYVDETGKDLFFGGDPRFSLDDLSVYQHTNGGKSVIPHVVNGEAKDITLQLSQTSSGTFFIKLKPDLVDSITYSAVEIPNNPCHNYQVSALIQNNKRVLYDQQMKVWKFIK